MTLRLTLQNAAAHEQLISVRAEIDPIGFAGPTNRIEKWLTTPASSSQELVLMPRDFPALVMKKPRLWWPHGYGPQPLYRLTVEVYANGKISSRRYSEFGVRKVSSFYTPPQPAHAHSAIPDGMRPEDYPPLQTARVFTVNGRPIRLAGGSMVPDFLMTWSAQQYRDQVHLMSEGSHTVVRVWARHCSSRCILRGSGPAQALGLARSGARVV